MTVDKPCPGSAGYWAVASLLLACVPLDADTLSAKVCGGTDGTSLWQAPWTRPLAVMGNDTASLWAPRPAYSGDWMWRDEGICPNAPTALSAPQGRLHVLEWAWEGHWECP